MSNTLRLFRSLEEVAGQCSASAVTIGNFDGVHIGHQQILRRVVELADRHGWTPAAVTFDPHPLAVLAPERCPPLLSNLEQRAQWMEELGIQVLLILPFTHDLAAWSPQQFTERVLYRALGAQAVFVGDNFRFGCNQQGDAKLLAELGAQYGFTVVAVPAVTYRGLRVSSTAIRELLKAGEVGLAWRMLGRPYTLRGVVLPGQGLGRLLTVPTLNLAVDHQLLPARGVYVTCTRDLIQSVSWHSVTNIGVRPTFGGGHLTVETHLIDQQLAAAPARLEISFLYRLREEREFPAAEALKRQIDQDISRARRYFRRLEKWRRA